MSVSVHTLPCDDLIEHEVSEHCICGPDVEAVERLNGSISWHYIHHSLDGRELREGEGSSA